MKSPQSICIIILALIVSACVAATPDTPRQIHKTFLGTALGAGSGAAIGAAISGPAAAVGAAVGGVAGMLIGRDMQNHVTPRDFVTRQLSCMGVKILPVGEQMTLLIPADKVFHSTSPRMKRSAKPLLNTLAVFLSHYPMISMEVDAYSDNVGPSLRSEKLTKARAAVVAQYLWDRNHLDTRLLFTYGYGQQSPIASNQTPTGRAINRRIVIHFQWIPTYG